MTISDRRRDGPSATPSRDLAPRHRRHGWLGALTAVGTLITALLTGSAATADATRLPVDPARVDGWVADRMEAHRIPGVAVAIVQDGRTVHLRGYGIVGPSSQPVAPDTPFLIGSASKPFTAHVVRRLVDDGALSLDAPVLPHLAHLVDSPPRSAYGRVPIRRAEFEGHTAFARALDEVVGRMTRWIWPLRGELDDEDGYDG